MEELKKKKRNNNSKAPVNVNDVCHDMTQVRKKGQQKTRKTQIEKHHELSTNFMKIQSL